MKQVQLAIIGGGVISVEFATAFAAFGTRVTIVEARRACPPPLPPGKPGWRISSSSSGIGNWAVF